MAKIKQKLPDFRPNQSIKVEKVLFMCKQKIFIWFQLLVILTVVSPIQIFAQTMRTNYEARGNEIKTVALKAEVRDFLAKEVAIHFGDIKTLNPPPDRVNGSITTGEYTWGSFMRVVAAQSESERKFK